MFLAAIEDIAAEGGVGDAARARTAKQACRRGTQGRPRLRHVGRSVGHVLLKHSSRMMTVMRSVFRGREMLWKSPPHRIVRAMCRPSLPGPQFIKTDDTDRRESEAAAAAEGEARDNGEEGNALRIIYAV